jgi:hypothetical protein
MISLRHLPANRYRATAVDGPDSADPGKGDGCYAADASPAGEADDVNPAID